jgi:hypothetical protein
VAPVEGFCEDGSELTSSIKGGEFLDHLGDYPLLNKDLLSGHERLPHVDGPSQS